MGTPGHSTPMLAKRLKAQKLFHKKHYKEAHALLVKLCATQPVDIDACYLLGITCNRLRMHAEAIKWLQLVTSMQPNAPRAHHELGHAYNETGEFELAENHLKNALGMLPNFIEAWNELGKTYISQGQHKTAQDIFEKVISKDKDNATAHYHIGQILRLEGKADAAIKSYQHAIKQQPQLAKAHEEIAQCYYMEAQPDRAIDHYRKCLNINPRSSSIAVRLAELLTQYGRHDEAVKVLNRVSKNSADHINAIICLADVYARKKDYERSKSLLDSLIKKKVLHAGITSVYTRICRHTHDCHMLVELMESMLTHKKEFSANELRNIHFDLGKLYDSQGCYDEAFFHYRHANEMLPLNDDPAAYKIMIDRLIQTYSKEALLKLPHASQDTKRPIFIVGMPRSGTTLVEQILSSHPDVFGAGELNYITDIFMEITKTMENGDNYPDCMLDITQDMVIELSNRYLSRIALLNPNKDHVTDKMPHNYIHLGLIELLFPEAKIIHCKRDPADTCLSIYFQKFHAKHRYSDELTSIGLHYKQYDRLMNHWKRALNIQILDIQYQDVVTNTEASARKMLDFCGLAWDPECLKYYENKRYVNTASEEQINRPIYKESLDRWRHYEKHIGPLLHTLGYPSESHTSPPS